jgi:hypothetical protein
MKETIIRGIDLIVKGRWFEGVILILIGIGAIYFVKRWIARSFSRIPSEREYSKHLQLLPKTKTSKKEVEIDSSQRILCSDGNCIGVINEQGVCNTCGKPYTKEPE